MKRRNFLKFSLAGTLAGPMLGRKKLAAGQAAGVSFRFAHLTDMHVKPEDGAEQGLLQAIAAVNSLDPQPDFVIAGGDLVFDVLAADYQRADTLFSLYGRCMKNLKMPVYHVIGNHDIFGWYPWSTVSPGHPEYGKEMFRKRLGEGRTWRSFTHKGWHFILLDSIEWNPRRTDYVARINEAQMDWLKQDLAALDPAVPLVLVTHIPFFSIVEQNRSGANSSLPEGLALVNSKEVLELFEGFKLKLVLQGHLHRDERLELEDKRFIMSGAVCGAWWRGANVRTEEGFGVIDINNEDISYRYFDYGWRV